MIQVGTQILAIKDIPAIEADTMFDQFGKLVGGCDSLVGMLPENNIQTDSRVAIRGHTLV